MTLFETYIYTAAAFFTLRFALNLLIAVFGDNVTHEVSSRFVVGHWLFVSMVSFVVYAAKTIQFT